MLQTFEIHDKSLGREQRQSGYVNKSQILFGKN